MSSFSKECSVCGGGRDCSIVRNSEKGNRGKIMRMCLKDATHMPAAEKIFAFGAHFSSLQVNDLQSILKHENVSCAGKDLSQLQTLVQELQRQIVDGSRPALLQGETKSFRRLVTPMRDKPETNHDDRYLKVDWRTHEAPEVDHTLEDRHLKVDWRTHKAPEVDRTLEDRHLKVDWRTHKAPEVDHTLEVQLLEYAWQSLGEGSRITRQQEETIAQIINEFGNLNVTSEGFNQAKGARGGAFNVAVKQMREGHVSDKTTDHSIKEYFKTSTRSTAIKEKHVGNMCETIARTWDDYLRPGLENSGAASTTTTMFSDRVEEILAELKILEK